MHLPPVVDIIFRQYGKFAPILRIDLVARIHIIGIHPLGERAPVLDKLGEILAVQVQGRKQSVSFSCGDGARIQRQPILGYRKGEDGEPEIVPEEAEIVLKIYNLYLSGYSVKQIKEYLEQNNIPTKKGKSQWGFNVISNILTNER